MQPVLDHIRSYLPAPAGGLAVGLGFGTIAGLATLVLLAIIVEASKALRQSHLWSEAFVTNLLRLKHGWKDPRYISEGAGAPSPEPPTRAEDRAGPDRDRRLGPAVEPERSRVDEEAA